MNIGIALATPSLTEMLKLVPSDRNAVVDELRQQFERLITEAARHRCTQSSPSAMGRLVALGQAAGMYTTAVVNAADANRGENENDLPATPSTDPKRAEQALRDEPSAVNYLFAVIAAAEHLANVRAQAIADQD